MGTILESMILDRAFSGACFAISLMAMHTMSDSVLPFLNMVVGAVAMAIAFAYWSD